MPPKIPITYTFGNHMHWVDMQWLWGYHVLPGSARDMLRYCRETGAKGNLNFDGVGLEKMAAEAPEALAELRHAVAEGMIEPVGCSYGQPYGLFHGGESNIRQRIYGARVVRRLLGVWPKTFWEEEFDFFPQLPQILKGVGMEFASLYFQWTWHTPDVPKETHPVVWWEGVDGSKLKCATRNALNLHQWPEDFQILLDQLASGTVNVKGENPLILQWLELMPSPDWMCRSELMIPKLLELKSDPRFEVNFATLGEYLANSPDSIPVRRYGMGEVWHGMTLGKNGDNMRRHSIEAERYLLAAEVLCCLNSVRGRPYAQWDVYPTWELEEAWRELLQAQHHDNDECEGLCGHVGKISYEKSKALGNVVFRKNLRQLWSGFGGIVTDLDKWNYFGVLQGWNINVFPPQNEEESTQLLIYNSLGWEREVRYFPEGKEYGHRAVTIPAFGAILVADEGTNYQIGWRLLSSKETHAAAGEVWAKIVDDNPKLRQIGSLHFPKGVFVEGLPVAITTKINGLRQQSIPHYESDQVEVQYLAFDRPEGVELTAFVEIGCPDPGLNASVQIEFNFAFEFDLVADYPLGVEPIVPIERGLKKYPSGDWMTSPQWFEEVRHPFTAHSFVDFVDKNNPDRGVLIAHDGSQQWMLGDEPNSVKCILNAYDPWDEQYFEVKIRAEFLIVPHGKITNAERWKIAQEFRNPVIRVTGNGGEIGEHWLVRCSASNVVMTALYREESAHAGMHVENYAGEGIEHPFVVRFLELNGEPADAEIEINGKVAAAFRTNLLGSIESEIPVQVEGGISKLKVALKPREIATLYLDTVEGRKVPRNLDEHREIWATVHRVEE